MINQIKPKIEAAYAALFLVSSEEARVEGEIAAIANTLGYDLHVWTCTRGVVDMRTGLATDKTAPPVHALAHFEQLVSHDYPQRRNKNKEAGANVIMLMKDFHLFTGTKDIGMIRRVKEVIAIARNSNRVLMVLGCEWAMCKELEKEFTRIDVKLPDRDALREIAVTIAGSAGIELNGNTDAIVDAACGFTTLEAADAMSLAFVESGRKALTPAVIHREKAATLKKGGILEVVENKVARSLVAGLDILMPWVDKRTEAFSKEARDYGLPIPKGVLLVGVSGCGKSLVAKSIASIFDFPLLKLDCGRLFGSLIGESESRMREVIAMCEAMAPAVLWMDEIDKSMQQGSGKTDGGTSGRVFGSFLTWMNEKTAPVFVVATANDITALPPEFQRKGRFDEMFFLDLPTPEEREDIWKVQITKVGRKVKGFDLGALSAASEGWTGAEIEAVVTEGLTAAFSDGRKEPTTNLFIKLSKEVVPLSTTMADKVQALRDWAKGKARRASSPAAIRATGTTRKIA